MGYGHSIDGPCGVLEPGTRETVSALLLLIHSVKVIMSDMPRMRHGRRMGNMGDRDGEVVAFGEGDIKVLSVV